MSAVALGLVAGAAIDAVVGDPRRGHPVAGFGRLATALERRSYGDRRAAGVLHVVCLVAPPTLAAAAVERRAPRWGRVAFVAAVTATALGGTTLAREATRMADLLDTGDLDQARGHLPTLCGRDPAHLDTDELCRATVESVAENTSDAVVATVVWAALAGSAGVVFHRTVNTLDAMIGSRTTRYRRFGWAAARTDDVVNLLPARVTALLTVALAPCVGGRWGDAAAVWRRDAAGHPSPNAGPVEAAAAGALRVGLGGSTNRYGDHDDARPRLGDGPAPTTSQLRAAVHLSRLVGAAATLLAILVRGALVPALRTRWARP